MATAELPDHVAPKTFVDALDHIDELAVLLVRTEPSLPQAPFTAVVSALFRELWSLARDDYYIGKGLSPAQFYWARGQRSWPSD